MATYHNANTVTKGRYNPSRPHHIREPIVGVTVRLNPEYLQDLTVPTEQIQPHQPEIEGIQARRSQVNSHVTNWNYQGPGPHVSTRMPSAENMKIRFPPTFATAICPSGSLTAWAIR